MGIRVLGEEDDDLVIVGGDGDVKGRTVELTPGGMLRLNVALSGVENAGVGVDLSLAQVSRDLDNAMTADTIDIPQCEMDEILEEVEALESAALRKKADDLLSTLNDLIKDPSATGVNNKRCIDLVTSLKGWFKDPEHSKSGFIDNEILLDAQRLSAEISAEFIYSTFREKILAGNKVSLPFTEENRKYLRGTADVIFYSERVKNNLELDGYSRVDIGASLIRMAGWEKGRS